MRAKKIEGRKSRGRSLRKRRQTSRDCGIERKIDPTPLPKPGAQAAATSRDNKTHDRTGEPAGPRERLTTIRLYLREIGEVPLLTVEQENQLAARIRSGDDSAREQMIRANLRLVVHIAHEYEHLGMPLLDLINEGNIGLMKAVERFDPAKGAKFSTYGSLWIKQAMRRALADQARTIRLPVNAADTLYRMRRTAGVLNETLGRDPTDEELAQEMGLSTRRVTELSVAALHPASLDAAIGDEETSRLGEVVEDEAALNPGEDLAARNDLQLVGSLLKHLDHRSASILRLRFGLDGKAGKTLEEIGRKFGLTRERIRQLQNEALAKLRQTYAELNPRSEDTIEVAA